MSIASPILGIKDPLCADVFTQGLSALGTNDSAQMDTFFSQDRSCSKSTQGWFSAGLVWHDCFGHVWDYTNMDPAWW